VISARSKKKREEFSPGGKREDCCLGAEKVRLNVWELYDHASIREENSFPEAEEESKVNIRKKNLAAPRPPFLPSRRGTVNEERGGNLLAKKEGFLPRMKNDLFLQGRQREEGKKAAVSCLKQKENGLTLEEGKRQTLSRYLKTAFPRSTGCGESLKKGRETYRERRGGGTTPKKTPQKKVDLVTEGVSPSLICQGIAKKGKGAVLRKRGGTTAGGKKKDSVRKETEAYLLLGEDRKKKKRRMHVAAGGEDPYRKKK